MATHSSILAWNIPWTEEPGGLQSMGHKELDMTEHTSKALTSPSNVNERLAKYSILGCMFFLFITLNKSCYYLLACIVSAEKSIHKLMEIPWYIVFLFPCYF